MAEDVYVRGVTMGDMVGGEARYLGGFFLVAALVATYSITHSSLSSAHHMDTHACTKKKFIPNILGILTS